HAPVRAHGRAADRRAPATGAGGRAPAQANPRSPGPRAGLADRHGAGPAGDAAGCDGAGERGRRAGPGAGERRAGNRWEVERAGVIRARLNTASMPGGGPLTAARLDVLSPAPGILSEPCPL